MSFVPRATADRGYRAEALSSVIAAARACFAQGGVSATTMEIVAQHAGLSRPTLYRHVASRVDLVELSLLARCREFSTELRAQTNLENEDLADELITLVLATLGLARDDPEFGYLTDALPRLRVGSFLTGARSAMHDVVYDTFIPVLARARERGLVRIGPSDHDLVEMIQGVLVLFAARPDLTAYEQRWRVELFLLPAVFGG